MMIESYMAKGGYKQFLSLVEQGKTRDQVLEIVEESGLQGRGGASFPTGKKWRAADESSQKTGKSPFFIVNADESQPGTFKDRLIMENNPHLAIEGALIGAYAVGAGKIFIYVNGKYVEQLRIMERAAEQAREKILTKASLAGLKKKIKLQVVQGAGGYIYGEETTLINSLEGWRGEPREKPPFPPVQGLFSRPTIVNNLETIANLPFIIKAGVKKFRELGTKESPGTKLFTVLGAVKSEGVYEFGLGIKIKELLEACGGLEKGKELAQVQVGGIGNFFGPKQLNVRLTLEDGPGRISAGLGNVFVMDTGMQIEDLLLSWAEFYKRESCGKCAPCREGNYQLLKIAERFKQGKTLENDWENIRAIIEVLEKTSFCALGKFAASHWKTVIKIYRKKFFAHDKTKDK